MLLSFLMFISLMNILIGTIFLFRLNIVLVIAIYCLIVFILASISYILYINPRYKEWGFSLTSPPKPHGFVEAHLQSSISVPLDSTLIALTPIMNEFINQWYNVMIIFTIKGLDIALTTALTAVSTTSDSIIECIQISTPNIHYINKFNPWLDSYRLSIWVFNHAFYCVPLLLPILQSTSHIIYRFKYLSDRTNIFVDYKQILFLHWFRIYLYFYYFVYEDTLVNVGYNLIKVLYHIYRALHHRWMSYQYPGWMWVDLILRRPIRGMTPTLVFVRPLNVPQADPLFILFMYKCIRDIQFKWYLLDVINIIRNRIVNFLTIESGIRLEQAIVVTLDPLFAFTRTMPYTFNISSDEIVGTIVALNGPPHTYLSYYLGSPTGIWHFIRDIIVDLDMDDLYQDLLTTFIYFFLYF